MTPTLTAAFDRLQGRPDVDGNPELRRAVRDLRDVAERETAGVSFEAGFQVVEERPYLPIIPAEACPSIGERIPGEVSGWYRPSG